MIRLVVDVLSYLGLFAILLFVPAGTIHWWRAWALLAVILVVRTISVIAVARVNREVLIERSRLPLHPGQPFSDKVLLISFMGTFAAMVAFASLDIFHLHLLRRPSRIVSTAGLVLSIFGWVIVTFVLQANAFASAVVRYQEERKHKVVEHGPYRFVRHPLYAGLIPVILGIPLWLESYAAAITALIPIVILIIRIHLEERFLKQHLEAYEAYTGKVRKRLIPGIW